MCVRRESKLQVTPVVQQQSDQTKTAQRFEFLTIFNTKYPPLLPPVCRTSHRPPTRERGRAYERPTRHRPGWGRTWKRLRRRLWSCRRWSGRKPVPPFPSWARRSWTCRQKCDTPKPLPLPLASSPAPTTPPPQRFWAPPGPTPQEMSLKLHNKQASGNTHTQTHTALFHTSVWSAEESPVWEAEVGKGTLGEIRSIGERTTSLFCVFTFDVTQSIEKKKQSSSCTSTRVRGRPIQLLCVRHIVM